VSAGGDEVPVPRYGNLQQRLTEARDELARLRESLRILDEQVAFQQDVADEAETRAIVSETPLADRECREAQDDLRRLKRERQDVAAQMAELASEQDRLLDRLLDQQAATRPAAGWGEGA
jgi:chromosome segregation ATPase